MNTKTIMLLLLAWPVAVIAQPNKNTTQQLQLFGTRSWIRVLWMEDAAASEYRIFWSDHSKKPGQPNLMLPASSTKFYIQDVKPATTYYVWLESVVNEKTVREFSGTVTTRLHWIADPLDEQEAKANPSSAAVPKGMQIVWQDEFNDALLNRNKWFTNYYSSIDYLYKINFDKMKAGQLPQPAYILNGKTINLFTNDSLPKVVYDLKNDKKISSIQTYDWGTNQNLLDNSRGGYFEVKVKRSSTGKPRGLNTAFWFDSPGPDLKYYLQQGTLVNGVQGIRPKGQVFEIDVFEYLNAQFVLHGHVDSNGNFQRNLATHIAEGYTHINNWVTHGILWTPTAVKHYINGNLVKEYTDKHQVYSPNHFMNVLLGSYGGGGTVNMEVDYIRYYNWPLQNGNELPNPGFEVSESMTPWDGTGTWMPGVGKNKTAGVKLLPQQKIEQYVYLDNNAHYVLDYWHSTSGQINLTIQDAQPVTGALTPMKEASTTGNGKFQKGSLHFFTAKDYPLNKRIIRIAITNEGHAEAVLDEITLTQLDEKNKQ